MTRSVNWLCPTLRYSVPAGRCRLSIFVNRDGKARSKAILRNPLSVLARPFSEVPETHDSTSISVQRG